MLLGRAADGEASPAFRWLVRRLAFPAVSTAPLLLADAWLDVQGDAR